MTPRSVFVGLVSHPGSQFCESQGPEGLVARLVDTLEAAGVRCSSQINTRNLFDEAGFLLTPVMARASVRAEIQLEGEWFRFLKGETRLRHFSRILSRYVRFALSWRKNSGTRELRRLLNIEYSHVDLYRTAIASGSDWSIILEDDAFTPDQGELALGLKCLFEEEKPPKFVNLSESFPLGDLGISHLLTESSQEKWIGASTRVVYQAERPATNTVCAIVFHTNFLAKILADFDAQPTQPIVPIDWKLNDSLMRLWDRGEIGPNECWFVKPAPIVQLSMVHDHAGD